MIDIAIDFVIQIEILSILIPPLLFLIVLPWEQDPSAFKGPKTNHVD